MKIPIAVLKALPRVCTGELVADRPQLNIVAIESRKPGTMRAVSTDGHSLVMLEWDTADSLDKPVNLPPSVCSAALALANLDVDTEAEFEVKDDNRFTLGTKNGKVLGRLATDVRKPDYEPVIASVAERPSTKIFVSAKKLADALMDVHDMLESNHGPERHQVILDVPHDPKAPIKITSTCDAGMVTALVMPMLGDKER